LWRSQKNDYFQLYFAASAQKPPELAKYNQNSPPSKKLFAPLKKFVTFATLLPRNFVGAGR